MHGRWCIGEYLPYPRSFSTIFSFSLSNEMRVHRCILVIHRAPSRWISRQ